MNWCKSLLLFFCFMLPLSFLAQENTGNVKWSGELSKSGAVQIIGVQNDKNYICFVNEEDFLVTAIYDKDFKEIASKKTDFKIDGKSYIYHKSVFKDNKIIHFVEHKNKEAKKTIMFAVVLNSDLDLEKRIDLEEIDLSPFRPIEIKQNIAFAFEIEFSPNFSRFAIRKYHYAKDYRDVLNTIRIYDTATLKPEYSYDFNYDILFTQLADILVDDNSTLYLLNRITMEMKESDGKDKRSVYSFERINKSLEKKSILLGLEGKQISSLSAFILDNEIVFTGFKNDLEEKTISKYFYLRSYDPTTLTLKKEIESEMKAIYPEKPKYRNKMIYIPFNVFKKNDGSYIVVSEQYSHILNQYSNFPILGDIAVISADFAKHEPVALVTKIQRYLANKMGYNVTSDPESLFVDNSLYLFFEDNLENISIANEADYADVSINHSDKNGVYQYIFKEDGSISKKIVYPNNISKDRIVLKSLTKDNNGGFIFSGKKKIGLLKS
nr:hypothetical protein [uncultured Flavobacterium sp.]